MAETTATGPARLLLDAVRLIDVRQLADLLGVSVRAVWRWSAEAEAGLRKFPRPLRLGPKTVRWRLSDARAFVDRLAGDRT